jgi:hypothetical protein
VSVNVPNVKASTPPLESCGQLGLADVRTEQATDVELESVIDPVQVAVIPVGITRVGIQASPGKPGGAEDP